MDLRPIAFCSYTPCRIMPDMADKRHYLKEWRKHRGFTQDQVLERLAEIDDPLLPGTGASLSRVENGKQPYSERLLGALADIYRCEPWELIGRNPEKEGRVIDFWARKLNDQQQKQALAILEAMVKTGS